jgi:hypothetical protein
VFDIITLLRIKDDWAGAVNSVVELVVTNEVPDALKKLLISVTSPPQHVGLHPLLTQSQPYGTLALAL